MKFQYIDENTIFGNFFIYIFLWLLISEKYNLILNLKKKINQIEKVGLWNVKTFQDLIMKINKFVVIMKFGPVDSLFNLKTPVWKNNNRISINFKYWNPWIQHPTQLKIT